MRRRRDPRPVLPVPMPVCPECDKPVNAMLCQAAPRTPKDVEAIQALLLAMHRELAHRPPPMETSP